MERTIISKAYYDVNTGKLIPNARVRMNGSHIVDVSSSTTPVSKGKNVIDASNLILLPGLVDAHTHITYSFNKSNPPQGAIENLDKTLNSGFTIIRDMGCSNGLDLKLRDGVNHGSIVGPEMYVSGTPIFRKDVKVTKGHDTERQLQALVKQRVSTGCDWIKVFQTDDDPFSAYEMRVIVKEAQKAGCFVAAHANSPEAVIASANGGVRTVEHGSFLDSDAIDALAKNKTYLVPTLYLPNYYFDHEHDFPSFGDNHWNFFERMRDYNVESARAAFSSGVPIVYGTDAVAGMAGKNAMEFVWLEKAGLKLADSIRSATVNAWEMMGLKEGVGVIGISDLSVAGLNNVKLAIKGV